MSLFSSSRDSALDLLGQAREKVLAQSPKIPPPGTLQRPGRVAGGVLPRFNGGPVAAPVIEKLVEQFVDVDGDPLLVIDDELDVSAITPEEGVPDEEPPKVLGVRADTAVVFGIGLVLVVAIAYLAGRTGKPPEAAGKPDAHAAAKAPLQPPTQAPPVAGSPLDVPAAEEAKSPAPAASKPADDAAPVAPAGPASRHPSQTATWEIQVVTTSEAKADKVVAFLNESPKSPIADRMDVEAYAAKGSRGAQVRIKGLEKKDEALLEKVQGMSDPTGGGSFKGAGLRQKK